MKRKIVSLLLAITLMVSLLPLSGCGDQNNEEAVTRGEWITMLSGNLWPGFLYGGNSILF